MPGSTSAKASPAPPDEGGASPEELERARALSKELARSPAAGPGVAGRAKTVKSEGALPLEASDTALKEALAELARGESAPTHRAVADAYRRLGVLDIAFEHYRTALRFDTQDGAAHDGLARIRRDWGQLDLALSDAQRARHFAPATAEVVNTQGTIYWALGRHADALEAFQRAALLYPRAAWAHSNHCQAAAVVGQRSRAVAACRRAVALDPSLAPARAFLETQGDSPQPTTENRRSVTDNR
jgi:tetratricopeptide (TPR) repeat protein